MRRLLFLPLALMLTLAACGGQESAEGDTGKVSGDSPPVEFRDVSQQRESLTALQNRADQLALSVAELQMLTAKITALGEEVRELQTELNHHRELFEESAAVAREERQIKSNWLTNALVFLLGIAVALSLILGFQLIRGYDEGDLPAEADTPGMTTDAPPIEDEVPTSGTGGGPSEMPKPEE